MRCVTIVDGHLELAERPTPEPVGRQVRVRVTATGVNRADLLQRAGRYPAPAGVPADIPGLELAGVVDSLGPLATGWRTGDRVMGLVAGGAHAEYAVLEDDQLVAVPEELSYVDAGGAVEVFATAHDALVTQAGLRSGETVLIHAVASGVGTAALQLVHALGARAVGTTRTPEKLEQLLATTTLAAGCVITDPTDEHAPAHIAELGPPDVILDLVGGPYVTLGLRAAAHGGRIIVVGTLAGGRAELPLGPLMGKRLTVRGTVLRSRPQHEKAAVMAAFSRQVVPLLASGKLSPSVTATFRLEDATAAYDLVASDGVIGKVVLTV